jgi:hypothetical protein
VVAGVGQDEARGLDAVQVGHADIHQDDIRGEPFGQGDRLGAVGGLAHHLHARLTFQDQPEAGPDRLLVIGDEDAHDHRAAASR